jgi:lactam utilization protein B
MNAKTQKLINAAKNFLGFKNLIVFTADQMELDFYELEDGAVIEVGAKAFFDGADADGEFVTADGETYVFVAGELTEIKPVEDVVVAEDKDAIIAALEEQLSAMTAKAVDLSNEVKAKTSVILNFQAKSKTAPTVEKATLKKEETKSNNASAIANLRNNLKK